ncbi:FapA family protein [Aquabacterium sp.]|uniref:DUF342 domain-containing protein n=1 Tax=Aquabacterium sp. TaxID=1872578 RepID=UPI00248A5FD0|nr:FapA family protein [Aquabacterium sp.]MDI1261449.1 FapA family protein [Aquabacterium sp.]
MSGFPGVDLIEAEGQLWLQHRPMPDRPALTVAVAKDLIAQAGHADWFLLDNELHQAVSRCASEESFKVAIAERRDASFELEIAPDAMCAWVTVTPARGGSLLNANDVVQALAQAGVLFGVDEASLQQVCTSPEGGRVVAALGKPARHGEDARFEMLVDVTRDRRPKVGADGLIDFRELGDIPVVEADQALMRIIPETAGFLGRNINAEVLEPVRGQPVAFAADLPGAKVDAQDPKLLRAVFAGQPVRVGDGVMVEKVVFFNGASIASGNITFDGTVQIEGDVLTGMKVQASGDIIVTGTVDGGHLEAGGSIRVGGGIIALATARAGDSVSARFVEHSQVDAGVGIAIDSMALQSQLQAGNQIIVGTQSPQRGRLVGGSARAMMLIRTPLLGDPSSTVTQVLVGVNPVLEAEYQEVLGLIAKQNQEEENLSKLVQHLTRQGDKTGVLDRVRSTWAQALQALGLLLVRKDDLDKRMALFANARVEIGAGVSGAVDLAFGKTQRRLRRTYDIGYFSIDKGLVLFTTPDGDALVVDG